VPKKSTSETHPTYASMRFGLSRQLIFGLTTLIGLILVVSSLVIWFKGRPLLEELGQRSQVQLGQNVALALEQEMSLIAGISRSMASVAESLPKSASAVATIIPPLLNQLGEESIIAGGGIWPEPYAFDTRVERSSFFWGRDSTGKLQFYDDYNEPSGPGYHNEEWYVPARLLTQGEVYWSKSYTDPYSLQPMVTCTAPIFREGEFVGVATIDLKLERVSLILDTLANGLDAYAFVVDRNNKFIAYPYPDRVMTVRIDDGQEKPDFIFASELAEIEPSFRHFSENLSIIEKELLEKFSTRSGNYSLDVNVLETNSYQIAGHEARRIAAHLWSQKGKNTALPEEVDRFGIDRDSILGESATVIVFQMPATNWKVVTVLRKSVYLTLTDRISHQLMLFISLATLGFGLLAYLLLQLQILRPIKLMVDQLATSVEEVAEGRLKLIYTKNDELGVLAYWFNLRSEQLEIAREQAERANKAKTDFLAKMSHELRTPLNSIIGFSRRLLDKLKDDIDDFYYEVLQRINSNGDHLLELVNDVLDLAAIESGEVKLNRSWHSVNAVMKEGISEVRMLAKDKNLDIFDYPMEPDIEVYCDKNKIIQVLTHLFSNAIKATAKGSIRIQAFLNDRRPGFIAFEVSDSGTGISEPDQHKLFLQFSQVNSRLGAERGTGLGLFLVQKFIAMHGGDITVASKLGEGATFTFYIPMGMNS